TDRDGYRGRPGREAARRRAGAGSLAAGLQVDIAFRPGQAEPGTGGEAVATGRVPPRGRRVAERRLRAVAPDRGLARRAGAVRVDRGAAGRAAREGGNPGQGGAAEPA